jgi:hypothetical protein
MMVLVIGREQLVEATNFGLPVLIVAQSGFHQQHRDSLLYLDHLPNQKVPLRQKSHYHGQRVGDKKPFIPAAALIEDQRNQWIYAIGDEPCQLPFRQSSPAARAR